jgi:hypothetical protein
MSLDNLKKCCSVWGSFFNLRYLAIIPVAYLVSFQLESFYYRYASVLLRTLD